ncbi:uncharacterized protein B0T15DRAFT_531742 [Chaetomium strumarium]|uniref:BTB domain-containing protein n=1 Tax=Chaetomium strumarium TaxID=1170767 RepID=A0AAJ0GSU3_9PEZI|nr:hypothetical protein B0T15DRAFT_531742 [Chaetomium strumarium]
MLAACCSALQRINAARIYRHGIKMEPIRWEDIASSDMFRFSVGPERREFTMHRALVAHLSPVLAALVNNTNFKEARGAHAVLEEVDEQTFTLFAQYAYTVGL